MISCSSGKGKRAVVRHNTHGKKWSCEWFYGRCVRERLTSASSLAGRSFSECRYGVRHRVEPVQINVFDTVPVERSMVPHVR